MNFAAEIENKNHYFTDSDLEKITEDAFIILEKAGIKIPDEKLRDKLKAKGHSFRGDSMTIGKKNVKRFLEALQKTTISLREKEKEENMPVKFTCTLNGYSDNIELPKSSEIKPFDTPALIDATKYCSAIFEDYGYQATMPGLAHDVHPDLIPLLSCKIGAQYIYGGWSPDVYSIKIITYMLEMCDVMEVSIDQVAVYMINPLTLAGESLNVAIAMKDDLKTIRVRTLPTLGVTTPLDIPSAISLSFAEVLGGAFAVSELTGRATDIAISLFPFDFRDLNIMYGSVEKQILGFMADEINVRLNLVTKFTSKKVNLTNVAKVAGIQSYIENAQTVTAGAMAGGRNFRALGSLSCGEVFSPVQMIADLESIKRAEILINGMPLERSEGDIISLISIEKNKNFFDSERSLLNHGEYIWYPRFFDRMSLDVWVSKGSPDAKDRIVDYIENIRKNKCGYRIEDSKFNSLEKIYEKAAKKLS